MHWVFTRSGPCWQRSWSSLRSSFTKGANHGAYLEVCSSFNPWTRARLAQSKPCHFWCHCWSLPASSWSSWGVLEGLTVIHNFSYSRRSYGQILTSSGTILTWRVSPMISFIPQMLYSLCKFFHIQCCEDQHDSNILLQDFYQEGKYFTYSAVWDKLE